MPFVVMSCFIEKELISSEKNLELMAQIRDVTVAQWRHMLLLKPTMPTGGGSRGCQVKSLQPCG